MKAAAMDRKPKIALGVIALIAIVCAVLLVAYGGQMGAARPAASARVMTVTSTTEGTVIMSGDVLGDEQLMQSGGTLSV